MIPHSQGTVEHAVTRDGRRLFLQRTSGPAGTPTVVLEAGMGATRSTWAAVQRAIGGRAPVVVYDRAGLGRSPADPAPRTLARIAADLNDVLDHVGADRFVLAGHSWGGPIVRVATAARPERVTGMVLVDATDEGCDEFLTRGFARRQRVGDALLGVFARTGLHRLSTRSAERTLPADAAADLRAELLSPAGVAGHRAESRLVVDEIRALRHSPPPLGDAALTVVSGTSSAGIGRRGRASINAAHAARAAAAPRGRHVLAHRSGHLVPLTEPDLVADEIALLAA